MTDLADWLRATIERDKSDADLISAGGFGPAVFRTEPSRSRRWEVLRKYEWGLGESHDEPPCVDEVGFIGTGRNEHLHITRHDPHSVIARCEADLLILDEHHHHPANAPDSAHNVADFGCGTCHVHPHDGGTCGEGWCRTVRLLAWGYRFRDLPGYTEVAGGWAP